MKDQSYRGIKDRQTKSYNVWFLYKKRFKLRLFKSIWGLRASGDLGGAIFVLFSFSVVIQVPFFFRSRFAVKLQECMWTTKLQPTFHRHGAEHIFG